MVGVGLARSDESHLASYLFELGGHLHLEVDLGVVLRSVREAGVGLVGLVQKHGNAVVRSAWCRRCTKRT